MTETATGQTPAQMLADPASLECPYPLYDKVRGESPALEIPGVGFLVTRFDDAVAVLRDPATFSSAISTGFATTGMSLNPRPAVVDEILAGGCPEVPALLFTDDPAHRRHRSLVSQAFNVRRVRQLEDTVRQVAEALLARFLERGEVELLSEFGVQLPLTVVAGALGVPAADLPKFASWSQKIISIVGRVVPDDEYTDVARHLLGFQEYFLARITERRAEPKDDLLSDLVRAREDELEPLSDGELLNIITQLLVAGNETTANSICTAVSVLAGDAALTARLRGEPELIPSFVEEVLRLESPSQALPRVATADTRLGDVDIPAGSVVMVMAGAANRDPAQFPAPDALDIDRSNLKRHLAFGQGAHHCVGSVLARAELRVGLELILNRLDAIEIVGTPQHRPSVTLRGWVELPIRFTARAAALDG